ncbi:MAG: dTDP-glucose 4,6-dehydratase [Thermoplasmatota archaeon]
MRVLVTGGSGFIGSNFIHHLFHARGGAPAACCPDEARYLSQVRREELHVLNVDKLTYAGDPRHLHGVDRLPGYRFSQTDICDIAAIDALVTDFRPDAIVHFAAESHVDRSIEAGDVFVRTNVLGTQVLLDVVRRRDVPQFLHVSTDEVYGSIDEGSFSESDPLHPSSPYAASKASSDLLVLAHHHTYGLRTAITRCTNNYGPRQNPEKLLPKVIGLARENKPLPIYGDGMNVRDWLYVKDHCAAILRVLDEKKWGEIYNVAAQDERPNLEVVQRVLKTLGKPESLITFVKDRLGHDWRYSLDDRKLRGLGWAPKTSFETGLRETIGSLEKGNT